MKQSKPKIYWELGAPLFQKVYKDLSLGRHIACFAPIGAGKGILIRELKSRANSNGITCGVVDFRPTVSLTESGCFDFIADALAVPEYAFRKNTSERFSQVLFDLCEHAATKHETLWILVRDIMSAPRYLARAFLEALQSIGSSNRKVAVLVAGSGDFLPMTYGDNSPYRDAECYLFQGASLAVVQAFIVSRRSGRELVGNTESLAEEISGFVVSEGVDRLHEFTGGNLHFIQECLLTSLRTPGLSHMWHQERPWSLSQIEHLVSTFDDLSLRNDIAAKAGIRVLRQDRRRLDIVRKLLKKGDGSIPLLSPNPTSLEVSGMLRRTVDRSLMITSPVWRSILNQNVDDVFAADCDALHGDWDVANAKYENLPEVAAFRSNSEEAESRASAVLAAWNKQLHSLGETESPAEIINFFGKGLNNFYGFDKSFWTCPSFGHSDGESVVRIRAAVRRHEYAGANLSTDDEPFRASGVFRIAGRLINDRRVFWFEATIQTGFNDEYENRLEFAAERTSPDSVLHHEAVKDLRDTVGILATSLQRAQQRTYLAEIGEFRAKAFACIEEINRSLLSDQDSQNFVDSVCRILIDSKVFLRVQLALVADNGSAIQAIGSRAASGHPPINFQTDKLLTNDPSLDDVQQFVCRSGEPFMINDARIATEKAPFTEFKKCRKLGIVGLLVMPLKSESRTIGTLHLERIDRGLFTKAEIEIFEAVCDHIAMVLLHVRQFMLTQGAIEALEDEVRLFDAKGALIFRNRSAASHDGDNASGWCFRGAKESHEIRKPDSSYRVTGNGSVAQDILKTPILDSRKFAKKPFAPDPYIGYAERKADLTPIVNLLRALNDWMDLDDHFDIGERVLEYLRTLQFSWVRIYLRRREPMDRLRSLALFGTCVPAIERDFRDGNISIPAVMYSNTVAQIEKEVCLTTFAPHCELYSRTMIRSQSELPEFEVNDHPVAAKLQRSATRWLEVPLWVRDNFVGLVTVNYDEKVFTPIRRQLLVWAAFGAGIAFDALNRRDAAIEAEKNKVWKKAAKHASHQLQNRLIAPVQVVQRVIANKSQDIVDVQAAANSLQTARRLLSDMARYARDEPFKDTKRHRVLDLWDWVKTTIGLKVQELSDNDISAITSLSPAVGAHHSIVASLDGLGEVITVIVENTFTHAIVDGRLLKTGVSGFIENAETSGIESKDFCLEFWDNGNGVAEGNVSKIYEPEWSSKQDSESGLGLAIVREFLQRMGGRVTYRSSDSGGASFVIGFPIFREEV